MQRTHVIQVKLTPAEGEAWEALRRALGGGGPVLPRESDALRFVLGEACAGRGIAWPGAEPPASPKPEARPAKRARGKA